MYELPEINGNETESVIAKVDDNENQTVHFDNENNLNGVTYKEIPINIGKRQIIIKKR